MSLPRTSTQVSFPSGSVRERSTVLAVLDLSEGRTGIVTGTTPFHPLDHTWPDQPTDTGTLVIDGAVGGAAGPDGGVELMVVDCVTGGVSPEGDLSLGAEIPVRRGEEGWAWLVVHVVEAPAAGPVPVDLIKIGAGAELRVDAERRAALSAAHTGCHLLSLALNAALAPRWRKDPGRNDALGHPDFDRLAMESSRMDTTASTDVYRIGKSLRKKGFTADDLAADLPAITAAVNEQFAAWVAADAPVRIEAPDLGLTARRSWCCDLPEGSASIFCGGTHLHHLGELTALRTELRLSEDGTGLTAVTAPERR